MGATQLEHEFSSLEKFSTSVVIDLGLTLVKAFEGYLLVRRRLADGFEKAVISKEQEALKGRIGESICHQKQQTG